MYQQTQAVMNASFSTILANANLSRQQEQKIVNESSIIMFDLYLNNLKANNKQESLEIPHQQILIHCHGCILENKGIHTANFGRIQQPQSHFVCLEEE